MTTLNTHICLVCGYIDPVYKVDNSGKKICIECGENRVLPLIAVIDLANAYLTQEEEGCYSNEDRSLGYRDDWT